MCINFTSYVDSGYLRLAHVLLPLQFSLLKNIMGLKMVLYPRRVARDVCPCPFVRKEVQSDYTASEVS
jgi:hypothetical protein